MQQLAVQRVRTPLEHQHDSLPAEAPVVLFVSEDENLREAAQRALRREGFAVVGAGHAGHAVLACLGDARIDVLATELVMRDTSGPALVQRLRRYRPDLPAVYLADNGTPESAGTVVRPFTRDDLVRELDQALAAGF